VYQNITVHHFVLDTCLLATEVGSNRETSKKTQTTLNITMEIWSLQVVVMRRSGAEIVRHLDQVSAAHKTLHSTEHKLNTSALPCLPPYTVLSSLYELFSDSSAKFREILHSRFIRCCIICNTEGVFSHAVERSIKLILGRAITYLACNQVPLFERLYRELLCCPGSFVSVSFFILCLYLLLALSPIPYTHANIPFPEIWTFNPGN